MKPKVWLVLGMNDDNIRVIGPEGFDIVQMYGMIEYAKTQIEQGSPNAATK